MAMFYTRVTWQNLHLLKVSPTSRWLLHRNSSSSQLSASFNELARESAAAADRRPHHFLRWSRGRTKRHTVGPFGIAELAEGPQGFAHLHQQAEVSCRRLVGEILQPASQHTRPVVAMFDEMSDALCRVADMADCMRMVHPEEEFRCAAEDVCLQVTRLVEQLNTHEGIYLALKDAVEGAGEPLQCTDAVDHRVAQLLLADFHLSGIQLDAATRARFVQQNEECFSLGAQFMQGALSPRHLDLAQLPPHLRDVAARAIGADPRRPLDGHGIVVNGLSSHATEAARREFGYRAFYAAEPQQEQLLMRLLRARHQLAQLAGYNSFTERAAAWAGGAGSLLGDADGVRHFLELLAERVRPLAERDLAKMNRLLGGGAKLKIWDVAYVANLRRRALLDGVSEAALSRYFSLGACMEGLALLCDALFELRLAVDLEVEEGELWHRNVRKLAVSHPTEGLLGYVYLDLLERPHKPSVECHYTVRGGRRLPDGAGYQCPIVTLQLNLSAQPDGSCCLSLGEVENLFHEFGHALHSMMGRTRYQHVTGTRCSTDFAEVPSTLLERFAFEPQILRSYARHHDSGEPLPEKLLQRLAASRVVFAAVDHQNQLSEALLDQLLHGRQLPQLTSTGNAFQAARSVCAAALPMPAPEGHFSCAPQHRFTHLVGYGAKYFAYLAARATSALLWHGAGFAREPLSRVAGQRLRYNLLAHGGERPASELVNDTLLEPAAAGEPLEHLGAERLVSALISDAEQQQERLDCLESSIK